MEVEAESIVPEEILQVQTGSVSRHLSGFPVASQDEQQQTVNSPDMCDSTSMSLCPGMMSLLRQRLPEERILTISQGSLGSLLSGSIEHSCSNTWNPAICRTRLALSFESMKILC